MAIDDPERVAYLKPRLLQTVRQQHRRFVAAAPVAVIDQVGQLFLVHHLVDLIEGDGVGDDLVKHNPADGRILHLAVDADLDPGVEVHFPGIQRGPHLLRPRKNHAFALDRVVRPGQVIDPQHDILAGNDDRFAVGRGQDVVGGHHEHPGLRLGLDGQRHMHGHLVPVEVRVEGRADQGMELDRLALDQHGFEGLDPQTMEGRRAVQHDRIFPDHLVEGVPDLRGFLLHELLGALDRGHVALVHEPIIDERLEQLEGHLFRQAALVQPQIRTHGNDGPARIVHPLAQKVLAEASLLALQHIGQGAQRPLVGPGDGPTPAPVVEQHVHGLLQHPLFVTDDDLRRVQLLKALQAVVPVDDPAIEVVEVGRGETPAVQGNEGTEIRRNDRKNRQDHPFRFVVRFSQRLDHLETLDHFLALRVRGRGSQFRAELLVERLQVDLMEEFADGLGADSRLEGVRPVLFLEVDIILFGQQFLLLQGGVLRLQHDPGFEIENLLQFLQRQVQDIADPAGQALQKPDVGHRRRQGNVTHPLATDLGLNDLHAAFFAHDPAVLHPFVAAAEAFVILHRSEDLGTEKTVPLRLEGPIVDRLRLLDLAVGPGKNLLRRGNGHLDGIEADGILRFFKVTENVFHGLIS